MKEGLGEDLIVTAIQSQLGKYSTGLDDMTALKAAGVSEKIIKAMIARGGGGAPSATPSTSSGNDVAGSPNKGPEPEFEGTVYWFDRLNNKLTSLERQKTHLEERAIPVPAFPAKGFIEVEGKRSPVRFATDSSPVFVFKASQGVDPQGLAQIFTLTVRKDHRELILSTGGGFKPGRYSQEDKESVPFHASKYNESSVSITPTMPLPPGEYGIRLRGAELQVGTDMFCFGVN